MINLRSIKQAFGAFARTVRALASANGFILLPTDKIAEIERDRRIFDREQWKRWYKANKKYQRQLRAVPHIRVNPNQSSLRREDVR